MSLFRFLLLALLALPVHAQEWPTRVVKFVSPYPPGGSVDPLARLLAAKLTDSLKQQFIVENRTGASGIIGTDYVAKSPPDGYTFVFIFDTHSVHQALNPNLRSEAVVTRTAGIVFQRGKVHRFRFATDFADTRKSRELWRLEAQDVMNLQDLYTGRVTRQPLAPGDTHSVGLVSSVLTGNVNLAWRHSQNWTTSFDYAWTECLGGRLDLYGRWSYFQRYDRELLPNSPTVDELSAPDSANLGLMKHRVNFGGGWSNPKYGFGLDGHYYHSRNLPEIEWADQHNRQINPYWQFDAYVQTDLSRWLPRRFTHLGGARPVGLKAQLRVNNIFNQMPPRYANDPSGAGVQSYDDWRRQTYALSLQATF